MAEIAVARPWHRGAEVLWWVRVGLLLLLAAVGWLRWGPPLAAWAIHTFGLGWGF